MITGHMYHHMYHMYHHWSYISSHSNIRICRHSSFYTDNMNSCLRFDYLGPRKEIGLTSAEKRPIYIPHQGWQVHFHFSQNTFFAIRLGKSIHLVVQHIYRQNLPTFIKKIHCFAALDLPPFLPSSLGLL